MTIEKGNLVALKHYALTKDCQTTQIDSVGLVVNVHGNTASIVSLFDGKVFVERVEECAVVSLHADFALKIINNHFSR